MAFEGFTEQHFDAYTPEKWSSNVHNLARMRAKDALGGFANALQTTVSGAVTNLTRGASDEVPNIINQKKVDAQWVYWFRDRDAQRDLSTFLRKMELNASALLNTAVHDQHIILSIALRHDDLAVTLRLAPGATVDRQNLAAMLDKSWHRDTLKQTFEGWDPAIELTQGDRKQPVATLSVDDWHGLQDQLGKDDPVLEIGIRWPKDEVVTLPAEALVTRTAEQFTRLAPVYRLLAWTKDNDHIDVSKQIQAQKSQQRRQVQSLKNGDKVRITGGFFSGQLGVVEEIDTKGRLKVRVGGASIQVKGEQVVPA